MSFGKAKTTTKKSPILQQSHSNSNLFNETIDDPNQTLYIIERYAKRLQNVESSLNGVCSQHDALMPLLSLLDTMPQLTKSDQQVRTTSKKITELQARLERVYNMQDTRNGQQLQVVESGFSAISKNLTECKQTISRLDRQVKEFSKNTKASLIRNGRLNTELNNRIQQNRREVQTLLAEFKNDVEIKHKKTIALKHNKQANTAWKDDPVIDKLLEKDPFAILQGDLKNLYREIGMIRIQLPKSKDIMDFHNYSVSRLTYQIYQTEEILQKAASQSHSNKTLQTLTDRIDSLWYQIKGLRKKYLVELNEIAQGSGRSIQAMERKMAQDLNLLEETLNTLRSKFSSLLP